jgi:hypothetical protein
MPNLNKHKLHHDLSFFGPHYPANVRKMSLQGDALLASHPKHVWPGFFFDKKQKKIKVVSRQGASFLTFF